MQKFKNTFRIIVTAVVLTFGVYGCSSNGTETNSDPEPIDLSEKEKKMVGTWKHVSTEGDGFGAGPVDFGTFRWTFNADGTGEYYQNPNSGSERSREITWRLNGDDLIFSNEEGEGEPTYRVKEYGTDQMKWHNYVLEDTNPNYALIYVVERQ